MVSEDDNVARRQRVVAWVAAQILPHEAGLRAWLRRGKVNNADIDDVVQEAYARIAGLDSVDHIQNGRAYFFQVARNVILEQVRRSRVVRIDSVAEIDVLSIVDDEPSPERATSARRELARVQRLIDGLPDKCRRVFELRKIQAMPQKEIAHLLRVSENTVEKQAAKGLRLVLEALAEEEGLPSRQAREVPLETAGDSRRDRPRRR